MGIVFNQSYKNIIIIAFALLVGGVNTLYFYPVFLKSDHWVIEFLLASEFQFVHNKLGFPSHLIAKTASPGPGVSVPSLEAWKTWQN